MINPLQPSVAFLYPPPSPPPLPHKKKKSENLDGTDSVTAENWKLLTVRLP